MTRHDLSSDDRHFAAILGLACSLLVARVLLIFATRGFQPVTWTQLPFFFRYDAFVILALFWTACWPARLAPRGRRVRSAILWTSGALLIVSMGVDVLARRYLHVPVTYRLLLISDHLQGLGGAKALLTLELVAFLAGAALITAGVAAALRLQPALLTKLRHWFFSWPATIVFVTSLAAIEIWTQRHPHYPGVGANPLWTFIASMEEEFEGPLLAGETGDQSDFQSVRRRVSEGVLVKRPVDHGPPMNVVFIVMESVGAKWLGLYGAPYQNSMEMERLARRGAVFDRAYASAPHTSSAMAALFCSVYPLHSLRTMTWVYPDLRVPALPLIFAAHGYRTAFVHGGNLAFDREKEFLTAHGFQDVIDDSSPGSIGLASERATLDPALKWFGALAPSQPFFLTLWTVQTHFPYHNDTSVSFGTNDERLERYLNGVRAADHLIGEVVRTIDRLGLSTNTMFVITGDHGETFGLHGKTVHGFEIYNEEMWTPLIIVAPGIEPQHVTVPVRQIDLAPTMLGILGYPAPDEWQGVDLTTQTPPQRAYLFTGWSDFTLGVIENERKAIFHFPSSSAELYDLRSDPNELRNLAGLPGTATELARSRQRVQAWIAFQNAYLARFNGPRDRE